MYAYDYEPPKSDGTKAVWIVDDDRSIRWVLEKALAREGIAYKTFSSAYEVLQALAISQPQVLVSDIRMPGGSGIELLSKIKASHPALPVIIMTAYSDLDSAVSAFQGGAFDYLPKPFDVPKAVELIRRAVDESLREEVGDNGQAQMPEMLGQAPAMQDVFRAIGRLSQSQVSASRSASSRCRTSSDQSSRIRSRRSPRSRASRCFSRCGSRRSSTSTPRPATPRSRGAGRERPLWSSPPPAWSRGPQLRRWRQLRSLPAARLGQL